MLGVFFTDQTVTDFNGAKTSNLDLFSTYYQKMLDRGVYLAPSQFEALFVSLAHQIEDIEKTIAAAEASMKDLGK